MVEGKVLAVDLEGHDGGALSAICVHAPAMGDGDWNARAPFWAAVQMYAAARSRQDAHPVVVGGDLNVWMDTPESKTTPSFMTGGSACGVARASGEGSTPLAPSRLSPPRRLDSFLLNSPTLPWSAQETVWGDGARPEILGSDHLPVPLRPPPS